MKSTLILSSAVVLALGTGAFSQSSTDKPSDTAGTSVGPAAGRPDVPPEPPAARFQQPGKEGMQAQGAAPGGSGTSTRAAEQPGVTPQQPSAKVKQPDKQQAVNPQGQSQGQRNAENAEGAGQATVLGSMSGPGHVTSTHELKQALQSQGFSDVRILAESFVVQAMKDGKRLTMMLGPSGLSAYQIVDENALNDDDDTTGSVSPDAQRGSAQR